jgi:hypothetical protein
VRSPIYTHLLQSPLGHTHPFSLPTVDESNGAWVDLVLTTHLPRCSGKAFAGHTVHCIGSQFPKPSKQSTRKAIRLSFVFIRTDSVEVSVGKWSLSVLYMSSHHVAQLMRKMEGYPCRTVMARSKHNHRRLSAEHHHAIKLLAPTWQLCHVHHSDSPAPCFVEQRVEVYELMSGENGVAHLISASSASERRNVPKSLGNGGSNTLGQDKSR